MCSYCAHLVKSPMDGLKKVNAVITTRSSLMMTAGLPHVGNGFNGETKRMSKVLDAIEQKLASGHRLKRATKAKRLLKFRRPARLTC